MKTTLKILCALSMAWGGFVAQAQEVSGSGLSGDLGMALYHTPAVTQTKDATNTALPYIYAEDGPFFGRVDTFGVQLAPLGTGHFEMVARASFEGYHSSVAGIQDRNRPVPVGFGTFQQGDWGGLFLYGFYDAHSSGTLLEGTYAAMFSVGQVNIYPQIGVERRSAAYVQSLYGVSASESAASGLQSYQATDSVSPSVSLAIEYPINANYNLNFFAKKKWLGSGISDSPLVINSAPVSGFISLSRSFK